MTSRTEGQCPHFNFEAQVKVARLEDTTLKYAEVTIICTDCGKPAVFRGLQVGLTPAFPTGDVLAQEARLPFVVDGDGDVGQQIGYVMEPGQ